MLVIFGGAFDPVHFGHLKPALELGERSEIEQLRFLPCKIHPQKEQVSASPEHRLAMLRLFESPPERIVDTRELQRDGISLSLIHI